MICILYIASEIVQPTYDPGGASHCKPFVLQPSISLVWIAWRYMIYDIIYHSTYMWWWWWWWWWWTLFHHVAPSNLLPPTRFQHVQNGNQQAGFRKMNFIFGCCQLRVSIDLRISWPNVRLTVRLPEDEEKLIPRPHKTRASRRFRAPLKGRRTFLEDPMAELNICRAAEHWKPINAWFGNRCPFGLCNLVSNKCSTCILTNHNSIWIKFILSHIYVPFVIPQCFPSTNPQHGFLQEWELHMDLFQFMANFRGRMIFWG